LLTIVAQDPDAGRAAAIANAMAEELIAAAPSVTGQQTDIVSAVEADLKALREQIDRAQTDLDALTRLTSPAPADLDRIDTLRDRLTALRSAYTSLLGFASRGSANNLTVIEPAVPPDTPVSPRPLLNAILAAVLAFILIVGLVLLIEFLNDAVKDADMVQQLTGLATLGTIPRLRSGRGRNPIYQMVTLLYPRSAAAESYRSLGMNLEFACIDLPARTILVTSAEAGEGKTVTAANLAVVLAQAGSRVLLVDADLRRPAVHELLGLDNKAGLTTVLRMEGLNATAISSATEEPNLSVLPSGILPANPAELLGSQRMRDLLTRMSNEVDVVILDAPPVGVVTDAVILSALVDGTVLVIDTARSHRRAVARAGEALSRAGGRTLGAILNRESGSSATYQDAYAAYGAAGSDATGAANRAAP
jgi:non-specific protein-tyrosine kinase